MGHVWNLGRFPRRTAGVSSSPWTQNETKVKFVSLSATGLELVEQIVESGARLVELDMTSLTIVCDTARSQSLQNEGKPLYSGQLVRECVHLQVISTLHVLVSILTLYDLPPGRGLDTPRKITSKTRNINQPTHSY